MRKRTLEQAAELLEEQAASGQSASEFCRTREISEQTFASWKKRASMAENRFVQLKPARRVELELSSGARVRVAVEDLKTVLSAL